jgi:uncharacterized membrane protein YfcA
MIIPAFIIFLWSGDMEWGPGLILAFGAMIGARIGAKRIMYHPKANTIIRYLLIAVIVFAIIRIFYPFLIN